METYNNLCTQFYELDKPTAPSEALNFYLEFARNANGPIFEPMCGTGRFLIPLLEAGFDIEGSDASSHMLSVCREKCAAKNLKPKLYQQFLQQMSFNTKYALIFIPSGSFGLITDPIEAKNCLRILHDHLLPNGKLVFEIETTDCVPPHREEPQVKEVCGSSGEKLLLTTTSSRIVVQSFLNSSCSNFLSNALFVPMMYRRFSCRRNSRLSSDVMPRSITQMRSDLPYRFSIISTIPLTVVTSAVFPEKTS